MKSPYCDKISQHPLLVHGTNILAVIDLLEKGYLPPSQKKGLKGNFHFAYTRWCSQSRGLRERGFTKREAIATAGDYGCSGGREYLFAYLGYPLKDFISLVPEKRNYRQVLKENYGLSSGEARDVVSKVYAFRGVIVEPSDAIFDFRFFTGDDFNNLAFHFPRGIPRSLVKAIFPLGEVERKVLAEGKREVLHELLACG